MKNQKSVAIYTRVSTNGQDTKAQECELRTFAAKRGWAIYRVYSDLGESGAKEKRPALDEMWAECRKRKIDVVCCWSLDRLARSLKQLIESLAEFRKLGIDFVCLKQDMDTTTSAGRLLFHIVGAVAEFERDLIRERVLAGMAQARREGKRIGRPALRGFLEEEREEILKARRENCSSIRQLALQHRTTQYTIGRILAAQPVASEKVFLSGGRLCVKRAVENSGVGFGDLDTLFVGASDQKSEEEGRRGKQAGLMARRRGSSGNHRNGGRSDGHSQRRSVGEEV